MEATMRVIPDHLQRLKYLVVIRFYGNILISSEILHVELHSVYWILSIA